MGSVYDEGSHAGRTLSPPVQATGLLRRVRKRSGIACAKGAAMAGSLPSAKIHLRLLLLRGATAAILSTSWL